MALDVDQWGEKAALPVRVEAVTREAKDILSFELVDPEGRALPPFTAGAHIEVTIRAGLTRQYSLCNDPAESHRYVIAVLKEADGRGGSAAMHAVEPGALLTVTAPRNQFPLAGPEASFHLLLAGGIGVTPMVAMVAELEARGADYLMHYCTRGLEATAFLEQLSPLVAAGKVKLHHDDGDPAKGLDIAATLAGYRPGMHVYFCGPAGFMSAARAAAAAWPQHTVHYEYFTAAEPGEPQVDKPFKIAIKKTGQVFEVPAGRTIVEVLRENGISVETDCTEGFCGTCITRYVSGEPEHRDVVLSEAERGSYVMICCARAKSATLELDL